MNAPVSMGFTTTSSGLFNDPGAGETRLFNDPGAGETGPINDPGGGETFYF